MNNTSLRRNSIRTLPIAAAILIVLSISLLVWQTQFVKAANPSGDLRIEVQTAFNLVVDSNVETPATYGPRSFSPSAKICNDGSGTLNNVTAYIGTYEPNPANWQPGIYENTGPNPTFGPVTYSSASGLSLTHVGGSKGSAEAIRFIGDLDPGECSTQYWLVSYPWLDDDGNALTGGASVVSDDVRLNYDIWASANGGVLVANAPRTVTLRNEISAMANKIWPNNDNQVPDEYIDLANAALGWDTLTASGGDSALPGTTMVTRGIWYRLGNVGAGFDNNADLAPDRNAWLQPIGDPTRFDPACFRLVKSEGVLLITHPDGTDVQTFEDQLYFTNIRPDNTNVMGLVYYTFVSLDGVCIGELTPYQEVASGYDNEKFNADFGYGITPLKTASPDGVLVLEKSASPVVLPVGFPQEITYQIELSNTGSVPVGLPALGMPLVISDTVPVGTSYIPGSASGSAGFDIKYSDDYGVTWTSNDSASVNMIQWRLQTKLDPSEQVNATYVVSIPDGDPSLIENTACSSIGGAVDFGCDSAVSLVPGTGEIGDLVWRDENGDGRYDSGSESGIPGVEVSLYYDVFGDGILDGSDPLITSDVSDSSGLYHFSDLPLLTFIVVVNEDGTNIPTGYAPSTSTEIGVNLGAANPDYTADFGFAPVLSLSKFSQDPGPFYAGEFITFDIELRNTRPGDGSGSTSQCIYTIPAGHDHPNTGTDNPKPATSNDTWATPRSDIFGYPDSIYLSANLGTNDNNLGLGGFETAAHTGETIQSVTAKFYVKEILDLTSANEYLKVQPYYGDLPVGAEIRYDGASTFTGGSGSLYTLELPLPEATYAGDGNWDWGDFSEDLVEFFLTGKSPGSAGNIGIDAVVLEVVSDGKCGGIDDTILTLPLTDTFEPADLEFISSNPPADESTTPGLIKWDDLGPLYPGGTKTVEVTFRALNSLTSDPVTPGRSTTNYAQVRNAAFTSGRPAGDRDANASVNIINKGQISGYVWNDVDDDTGWVGIDDGEARFSGVMIALVWDQDNDGNYDTGGNATQNDYLEQVTYSDQDGYYEFSGLGDGKSYFVVIAASTPISADNPPAPSAPYGLTPVSEYGDDNGNSALNRVDNAEQIAINTEDGNPANDAYGDVNFGYNGTLAVVRVDVWEDYDNDGVRDSGEPDIPEADTTVVLRDCGSDGVCDAGDTNTVTLSYDATSGLWSGDGLSNGNTYRVEVSDPSGYVKSYDYDQGACGSCDGQHQFSVDVSSGNFYGVYDFGYKASGTIAISGSVYSDWNGDAFQDVGDEGLSSAVVLLYRDLNNDGVIDSYDPVFATSSVASDGDYVFSNLPDGFDWIVLVDDVPSGYRQTEDNDTGPGVLCSASDSCDSQRRFSNLSADVSGVDFGYSPGGNGSIGDWVWNDADGNGLQGLQETGFGGVSVHLYEDAGGDGLVDSGIDALISTTLTTVNGEYLFSGLATSLGGVHYIVVVDRTSGSVPEEYTPSTATTFSVLLSGAASNYLDADAGFSPPASIGDLIFEDTNENGTWDYGEPGISGVTVELYNGLGVFITDTVSGPTGLYIFDRLDGGIAGARVNYTVNVVPPAGYTLSSDPNADGEACIGASDPDVIASCDNQVDVGLRVAQNYAGADFGYAPTAAIGDFVWYDADGDGVQDSGEPGIASVEITITPPAGVDLGLGSGVAVSTMTNFDGQWTLGFLDLPDGSYHLTYTAPEPIYGPTYEGTSAGDLDGDITFQVSGDAVSVIEASSCTDCDLDLDVGLKLAGANQISGTICLDDSNKDGYCGSSVGSDDGTNAGEYALEMTAVYLYRWVDQVDPGIYNNGVDDVELLSVAQTDANGFYRFEYIPLGVNYIVSTAPPATQLKITTSVVSEPAAVNSVIESTAYDNSATTPTTGVYLTIPSMAGDTSGVDVAYISILTQDFGDLPDSFHTSLGSNGPRHVLPAGVYLGNAPDSEGFAQVSTDATGDGADEDGVVVNQINWDPGLTIPNALTINVSGSGWLVGWVDFNDDGQFSAVEMIVNQAVSTGVANLDVDVPDYTDFCNNDLSGCGDLSDRYLAARFRVFKSEPTFPAVSFTGAAVDGEVEDYLWHFDPTAVKLNSVQIQSMMRSELLLLLSMTVLLSVGLAVLFRRRFE